MRKQEREANQRAITTNNEVVAKEKNNKRGITLIALVVTIVILLILAGVTLSSVLSNNGIITKAKDAKNEWEQAVQNDEETLNSLIDEFDEIMNEVRNSGGNSGGNTQVTLASLMETAATENETVEDINENKIVIPAGFKIVANGTSNVTYTYAEGANAGQPTVQDGIVIEDVSAGDTSSQGNQFVWVPIGEINNKDSSKTTITLGRYTFASDGTEALVQNATNYTEETAISTYYKELATSTYGNSTALDLEEWITTAQANGGYYIGRYEASYGGTDSQGNHIALSKQSTNRTTSSWTKSSSTIGYLWNFITQPAASTASQAMYPYSSDAKVYSDLINSYAWDTAIVFIQEYSGYIRGTTKYSRENGQTFSSSLQNTGTNGDKVCNIYDMASNTIEWTTETCTFSTFPCTVRGGSYYYSIYYTSYRDDYDTSGSSLFSFRPTLYVK